MLLLSDEQFLGVDRTDLHLSTGEQNFISLAFELLMARRTDKDFIVLDDPISSFDSLYKNKIAYCIVKFLENKKQLIFTHNTDLIKLLEAQQQGCFNLYLFNNTDSGKNGFIRVKDNEKDILLNMHKLIELFQNTICSVPEKSGYEPKAKESDGTVDAATTNEINEFLTTFFKLYPTATEKELSYYVNDGVLKTIGKDYVFSELINPIYNRSGNQVTVSLAVKYLDNQTKATQISQFDLVLEKDGNWKIMR